MLGSAILDVVLVLILLGYLLHGYRAGLVLSLGGILGIAAGAVAAFFAVPLVNAGIAGSPWRVPVVLLVTVVVVLAGQAVGGAIGATLRRGVDRTPLRIIDRVAGAVIDVVVAALLMSMLAFGIGSLGVPSVSRVIASSTVITTVDGLTPDPVKALLAQLRTLVVQGGSTRIIDTVTPGAPVSPPTLNTSTPALKTAARSVLKVSGDASQCGQTQSGSGFVVAPGRVVTNAHVLAGVSEPVVQAPGGGVWIGRVVYFDPVHDLAVIAVDGLPTPPLQLAANLIDGDVAVFDGYPLGGPFQSKPATVDSVPTVGIQDIYRQSRTPMQIYDLAADVQHGNSGGPLLNRAGQVAGVVFATSASNAPVGYALTMQELAPVVAQAPSLTATVLAGHCTHG